MTEQRDPPVAEAAREFGDRLRLGDERARRAVLLDDRARERAGIAAVPGEVEGDRDVAVAGERHGEGLHQLPRAGEAVGDDHRRPARALRRPVDGRGNVPDRRPLDDETVGRGIEPHERDGDREPREDRQHGIDKSFHRCAAHPFSLAAPRGPDAAEAGPDGRPTQSVVRGGRVLRQRPLRAYASVYPGAS